MNITLKKSLSFLLVVISLCSAMMLASCQSEPVAIENSDPYIVIKPTAESIEGKEDMSLADYMAELKEKGELDYTINNGMITSINAIENPADFSKCWMLYTSDSDNSGNAWGTIEYEGKECGSAVVGAESITLKPEHLYIWVFKSYN